MAKLYHFRVSTARSRVIAVQAQSLEQAEAAAEDCFHDDLRAYAPHPASDFETEELTVTPSELAEQLCGKWPQYLVA